MTTPTQQSIQNAQQVAAQPAVQQAALDYKAQWEKKALEYRKRQQDREYKRTTPSKYRKGFPLSLRSHYIIAIHMAYAYLKLRDKTTPTMDETITVFPDLKVEDYCNRTLRLRGDQVDGVIELFEAIKGLPGNYNALWRRIKDLKKITAMDKLMDAGR